MVVGMPILSGKVIMNHWYNFLQVYIVRAVSCSTQEEGGSDAGERPKEKSKQRKKDNTRSKDSIRPEEDASSKASGRRRSSRLK